LEINARLQLTSSAVTSRLPSSAVTSRLYYQGVCRPA
jgi:hypothetical protein